MFREVKSDGLTNLLPVVLSSRKGVLMVLHAFFDESETDSPGDPFTVAGYVFKPTGYKQFSRQWRAILRDARVPKMHMVDLYHGKEDFKDLSLPNRAALLCRVVGAITDCMMAGIGFSLYQEEFERLAPPHYAEQFGSIYAAACQLGVQALGTWMDNHRRYDPVAYVFEDGHKYEHQANVLLRAIETNDAMKKRCRYHSVTFVPKEASYGLQAADVLAWVCTRDMARRAGRKVNPLFLGGLRDLFSDRDKHYTREASGDGLKAFFDGSARDPTAQRCSVYVGPRKRDLR